MYEFKPLTLVSYKDITECFNLSFSDYSLPAQLSEADLEKQFTASDVNMSLSFGAFCHGKMIGFIINSCNTYNGVIVVFDVATAIVPEAL